jgi:hypothetical protein
METCREAARIANSSTDGGKHAFMEKGEFEGLVREGREKELKGEGEVEEEREEWKVCGCKGCEKWGALKETSVLAY